MLTSPSNQYLRPEYLTPLPTTLDAKKSPLALLAQTCSQIGADAPNSKLLQSAEKSSRSNNKSDQSKDKNSSLDSHHKQSTNNNNHNNSKQYDVLSREKSRSPEERSGSASTGSRVRTPQQLKNSSTNNGRCSSNQSAASPRASPAISERKTPANSEGNINIEQTTPKSSSERASPSTPASSSSSSSSSASLSSTTSTAATKTAFTPNILTSSSDPAIKDLPLGTFKPGVPVTSAFLSSYPPNAFPLPMDLMTSSLMSQHHALKTGGLSPYLSYGRMKTADSLSTVCRDPYCTGCGLSSHLLSGKGSNPCPAGCTQCDHAKAPPTTTTASYLGAAYAHAQLAALAAASHLPYACSWISGDASYCGKRFATSEELLSHLRTHTNTSSVSEANSAALSMLSAPPTHPLLHRTYPTPPLSPLATARYHPYSKPSPLLPPSLTSSLPGFPLSHPGLPPYLSPYSLYGPRLGATPGMHP